MRNKSLLFFQLGLMIMLFASWQVLEWKVYEKDSAYVNFNDLDGIEEEDIPITVIPELPPPPPPPKFITNEVIVEEDDKSIIEDVIMPTDPTDEPVLRPDDIIEIEEPQEIVYPLIAIEFAPVFPGCEKKKNNSARKKCLSEKITKHVQKHFDKDLGGELGLYGRQNIYVQFKIDKNGIITDIKARGPHQKLEAEAFDVINKLPKMTPGRQNNKVVGVLYSLPIIFKIDN